MPSEEEMRKIGWYSQFGAADPAEFQKVIAEHQALIAEVRQLQADNAKLLAACRYCRDWVATVEGKGLGHGIALVDWISLTGRLEDAVAGTAADPGRKEVEAWPTGSG
jgi:hypothetical protein